MTIAAQWPRPQQILRYYLRSRDALTALKKSPEFVGMTETDREQSIRDLAGELSHEVVLLLTASFEALVQVDFEDRVSNRRKDPISRSLYRLARSHERRRDRPRWIPVEEILDVWQRETGRAHLIGRLKQLFQFRHWLAHGRYWVQKSGLKDPDPFVAWSIGKAVFDALPGFDSLPGSE